MNLDITPTSSSDPWTWTDITPSSCGLGPNFLPVPRSCQGGLLSLPSPRLPLALTNALTWSTSGFWTPTHLVRLTLALAGALGIHPEVGVHVVGADASMGIADGRQRQAPRGHPKQQQQQRRLRPVGPEPAAPQGPHDAVCGGSRPPRRRGKELGPTGAFSFSGLQAPALPTRAGFLAAAAAASTESVEPAGLCGFR